MHKTRFTTEQIPAVDVHALMLFYSVDTIEELAKVQARHIDNLQKQLTTKDSYTRTFGVRYA